MSSTRFPLTSEDRERYHQKQIEFRKLPITQGPKAGFLVSGTGKLMIATNGEEGRADIFVDQWFDNGARTTIFHLPEVAFRSITAVGSSFLLDWSDKA